MLISTRKVLNWVVKFFRPEVVSLIWRSGQIRPAKGRSIEIGGKGSLCLVFPFERRVIEIEFSNYYGRDINPLNEFGHEFFTSWNDEQWNTFDNYMAVCVSYYLEHGIVEASINNPEEKKLRRETNIDFVDFISEYELRSWIKKADLYEAFLNDYPNFTNWLSIRIFNDWVKTYCKTRNIEFQERKRNDGQRHWVFAK